MKISEKDIISKIEENGEFIIKCRLLDTALPCYDICVASDRIITHKGRKAYYVVEVGFVKETGPPYRYGTIFALRYKSLLWKSASAEEISKLQILVETGRSVDHHIALALGSARKHCRHKCYINYNNEYEISGVIKNKRLLQIGICEHCGNQITINWSTDSIKDDNGKYYTLADVRCCNGCWINDPEIKKLYDQYYVKGEINY